MTNGIDALTDKEKETLRLIGRGHDAKSMARQLGISVHTVNERLRVARRKMSVTSSREAARILLDREQATPQSFVNKAFGEAETALPEPDVALSKEGGQAHGRSSLIIAGVLLMFLVAALAVLSLAPQSSPTADGRAATAPDPAVAEAARSWLALVDARDWEGSYRATGSAFRRLNSQAVWAAASEKVRVPLGAVRSRVLLDQQELIAPPHGYESLRFRTDFAAKPNATETVTLEREGAAFRVVSYVIE